MGDIFYFNMTQYDQLKIIVKSDSKFNHSLEVRNIFN